MDPHTSPPAHHLLEINLICARELKFPGGQRRMQCYAVAWVDPAAKVRTSTDLCFGENPCWSEFFVFRVPPAFVQPDCNSGVNIEIYAAGGGWYRRDSLVGTTRLLIGSLCLVPGSLFFTDVCVRHTSGRIHGVFGASVTLLSDANALTVGALSSSPAFSYRDVVRGHPSQADMVADLKDLIISNLISGRPSPAAERAVVKELNGENSRREGKGEGSMLKELKGENSRREEKGERAVLKELKGENSRREGKGGERAVLKELKGENSRREGKMKGGERAVLKENGENSRREGKMKDEAAVRGVGAGAGTLCGLGFPPRRIHLSLSAQNLQISGAWRTLAISLLVLALWGFLRIHISKEII